MRLTQIDISNFRGIRSLSLSLDDCTILIGENNTGKTTILDALQACLSRNLNRRGGIFSEYDYYLSERYRQPAESDPIEITLRFVERYEGEWPDEIPQTLAKAVQTRDDGKQSIVLRVRSYFDDERADFVTDWHFLDLSGHELIAAREPRNIISLQQLVPVFYLAALRDSDQEFRPRSQFWGPFVRNLKVDPDVRQALEDELAALNQRVLTSNESFDTIRERLSKTGQMVPLANNDPVSIEAIPSRLFDILARTQVMFRSVSGAPLPIGRHGEGTQSLAVMCLFDAFLQSRITNSYTEFTTPILTLEEPEGHLHPSATHSVAGLLQGLKGQKIIATHSGDLVAEFPLNSLRRFCRKGGEITVHQLKEGTLTDQQMQKINHHIRSTRGNLLFSRCWLLVEGETDRIIFEGCARLLGRDLVYEGVTCVEYRHIGIGVDVLIKLADSLGIEWLIVADGDQAGTSYVDSARGQLGTRSTSDHIQQMDHGDMEVFLCMEGYGAVFKAGVSPQKKGTITAKVGTIGYWEQVNDAQQRKSKPQNAIAVIDEMERLGNQCMPNQLRQIVESALTLASETE